jgi:hypothetical protein
MGFDRKTKVVSPEEYDLFQRELSTILFFTGKFWKFAQKTLIF